MAPVCLARGAGGGGAGPAGSRESDHKGLADCVAQSVPHVCPTRPSPEVIHRIQNIWKAHLEKCLCYLSLKARALQGNSIGNSGGDPLHLWAYPSQGNGYLPHLVRVVTKRGGARG